MNKFSKWSSLAVMAVLTAITALAFTSGQARADGGSQCSQNSQYGNAGSNCYGQNSRGYDSRANASYQRNHGNCNNSRGNGNYSYRENRMSRPRYHGTWENWNRGRQGGQGQQGWQGQQGRQGQDRRWKGRSNDRSQNDPQNDPRWDNSNQDQGNRSH